MSKVAQQEKVLPPSLTTWVGSLKLSGRRKLNQSAKLSSDLVILMVGALHHKCKNF